MMPDVVHAFTHTHTHTHTHTQAIFVDTMVLQEGGGYLNTGCVLQHYFFTSSFLLLVHHSLEDTSRAEERGSVGR